MKCLFYLILIDEIARSPLVLSRDLTLFGDREIKFVIDRITLVHDYDS